MKIKISKKTKRLLVLYIAALVLLYLLLFVLPEVTDRFETTQVLENGSFEVSCETTGYVVKDEAVCTATATGSMKYRLGEGTVVKKGTEIVSIEPAAETKKNQKTGSEYSECLKRLSRYDLLCESDKAPISGVFSTSVDGLEKYFSIDNLENISREKTEELSSEPIDLNRDSVVKGEPVFKISSDDNWYIVCWVEKADAGKFEVDQKVRITLPESTVDARVFSKKKEKEQVKVVFRLNVYYKDFCSAREVEMTVVQSNTTGLIVDNECIVSKNGQKGVYVKTKDDDIYFVPIKIKISDDKQSVIYESVFVNDDYEQVETVSVYQEVLRHPEDALEEDLKNESEEDQ